jgi:hypothetical protein
MPRREFRSVYAGTCDLGYIAIDLGNYVDVCAICADFEGSNDL